MTLATFQDSAPKPIHHISLAAGWTKERVEQLTQLAADGLSASQIGAELGITRNAAIGKIKRDKLEWNCRRPDPQKIRTRPRLPVQSAVILRKPIVAMPEPEPLPATSGPTEHSRSVPITDLFADECKWPVGEDNGRHLFCGARKEFPDHPDLNYCAAHARMAYAPRTR